MLERLGEKIYYWTNEAAESVGVSRQTLLAPVPGKARRRR